MQLGSMFISNCNKALHVSDAFCVHSHEHFNSMVPPTPTACKWSLSSRFSKQIEGSILNVNRSDGFGILN